MLHNPLTRGVRLAGPLSLGLAMSMAFALPALAHVRVVSTAPAKSEALAASPTEVVVSFSDKVQPQLSRISVTDSTGAAVDANDTAIVAGDATRLAVSLRSLPPGTYTVSYAVTCIYNHKINGKYTFDVGGEAKR